MQGIFGGEAAHFATLMRHPSKKSAKKIRNALARIVGTGSRYAPSSRL